MQCLFLGVDDEMVTHASHGAGRCSPPRQLVRSRHAHSITLKNRSVRKSHKVSDLHARPLWPKFVVAGGLACDSLFERSDSQFVRSRCRIPPIPPDWESAHSLRQPNSHMIHFRDFVRAPRSCAGREMATQQEQIDGPCEVSCLGGK